MFSVDTAPSLTCKLWIWLEIAWTNALTDVTPDSDEGKIVDIIIALWALSLAGTIIGIVGGMSVINTLVESAEALGEKFGKKKED